jgi:predicted NUDIX family NTP pyrophosphohydrolase
MEINRRKRAGRSTQISKISFHINGIFFFIMKQSAGILLYKRTTGGELVVLLVHPGGPFWKNKDIGAWSIPKGEFTNDEKPLDAAIREFEEEVGVKVSGEFIELKPVKLKSGKVVFAWALEKDIDVSSIKSNEFQMEWPPKSGKIISIPEIDKAEWFTVDEALQKINPAQSNLILQLVAKLKSL